MLSIDGSEGEGGGQILRTALACSLLTGEPFRIERIRSGRRRPGLLPQHLAAARAAAEVSGAETEGLSPGSEEMAFAPGHLCAGDYRFDIGTAGSTGLVLQTILVPLLTASGESSILIEGGTHNEGGPPFEFLALAFSPLLREMGADLSLHLDRPGFYPVGGGRIRVRVGDATWARLDLLERGPIRSLWARAMVSHLPMSIAERELAVVRQDLDCRDASLIAESVDAPGPGNALVIGIESEDVTAVFTGFGRRGLPAEDVASSATAEANHYLGSTAPVGEHLADQLLLPLTQAGGSFVTTAASRHFVTNASVIDRFFDVGLTTGPHDGSVLVECEGQR